MSTGAGDLETLQQLGLALGVLKRNGAGIEPNNDWLAHPGDYLRSILSDPSQRTAAIRLARVVLGEIDAGTVEELGRAEAESWIPMIETGLSPTTGIYAVLGVRDEGEPLEISLAFRLALEMDAGSAGASAIVRVPLVALDTRSVGSSDPLPARLLPGSQSGAIAILAAVDLPARSGDALQVRQASLVGRIPTRADEDPSFSITLRGVRLPGEAQEREIVFDGREPDHAEALNIVVALATDGAESLVGDVLSLLGLRPGGPLPRLDPQDLFTRGLGALSDRAHALLTDPLGARRVASTLARLLGVDADVSGTGTVADPFAFQLQVGADALVELTLAIQRDPTTGAVSATPGIRAERRVGDGRIAGEAELFAVRVGAGDSFTPLPRLRTVARIGGDEGPLVQAEVRGTTVSVGRLDVGLSLDEGFRPVVTLEAGDVSVAGVEYPTLDLTSADVAVRLAEGAGGGLTDRLVAALGDSPAGQALAQIAGLAAPSSVVASEWVDLVTMGELVTDALSAIANYHARVFDTPDHAHRMVAVFATALGSNPGDVSGSGTGPDPWRAALGVDPSLGATELLVWRDGSAQTLHLGLEISVSPFLGDVMIEIAGRINLVSIALPHGGGGVSAVGLEWGTGGQLAIRIPEATTTGHAENGAHAGLLELSLAWTNASGPSGSLVVHEPSILAAGEEVVLPDLVVRSGGSREPADLPDRVWDAASGLAADILGARGRPGLEHVAALFGWGATPRDVTIPDVGVSIPLGESVIPVLRLNDLALDPVAAARGWAKQVLNSGSATVHAVARLAAIGAGSGFDPDSVAVGTGIATPGLARIPLGADRVASLGILGARTLGIDSLEALRGALFEQAGRSAEAALETLARLAAFDPAYDQLLRERSVETILAALRALSDGDGLVPAPAQVREGWERVSVVAGHLASPRAIRLQELLSDVPAGAQHIFVACDLPGLQPWADQTPEQVVDLTQRRSAIDPSRLPAAGPWFVVLPRRGATVGGVAITLEDQVTLLEQTIATLAARLPATARGIAVIAHSIAGYPACTAAARLTSVSHLVTVATPHSPAAFERLDDPSIQDALAFARALLAGWNDGAEESSSVLKDLVVAASRPSDPVDGRPGALAEEFTPPALPDVPHARTIAVVASVDPEAIDEGIVELVRAVLDQRRVDEQGLGLVGALGIDLTFPLTLPDLGSIRLSGEVRIVAESLISPDEVEEGAGAAPAIVLHVEAHGRGGWLLPPTTNTSTPALRFAELDLRLDRSAGESVLSLHDAELFGVHRPRIDVQLNDRAGAAEFDAYTRAVLAAIAAVIPPREDGPARALVDVAAALGVMTVESSHLLPSAAGVERLLAAPGVVISEAFASDLLDPLTHLFPSRDDRGIWIAGSDDIDVLLDPSGPRLVVQTHPGGVGVGDLFVADLELIVDAAGISGTVIARPHSVGPLGPTRVVAEIQPGQPLQIAVEHAEERLQLSPDVDERALHVEALSLVVGALTSVLIDDLRRRGGERIDTLFETIGLVDETRSAWRDPARFVANVSSWLAGPGVVAREDLVARLRRAFDALRGLLGLEADGGAIALPWDLELGVAQLDDAVAVSLVRAPDPGGSRAAAGSLSVAISPDSPPTPELSATIQLSDVGDAFRSAAVEATLGHEASVAARFRSGGEDVVVPLYPSSSVVGLAQQGATAVLPMVLDALAQHDSLGLPLGSLGDALQLRTAGRFDAGRLRAFAAGPGERISELLAAPTTGIQLVRSLARLLQTIVGAERVSVDGDGTRLSFALTDSVRLILEGADTPRLMCEVDDFGYAGLRFSADMEASGAATPGIEHFAGSISIADGDIARVAGSPVFPFLSIERNRGQTRCEAGLWTSADADREAVLTRFAGDASEIIVRSGSGVENDDPAVVGATVARRWLLPLVADTVVSLDAVEALLRREVTAIGASIEDILLDAGILTTRSPEIGLDRQWLESPLPRLLALGVRAAQALRPVRIVDGLRIFPSHASRDGTQFVGVRFELDSRVRVSVPGGLNVELEADVGWVADDAPPAGLDLLLVSFPSDRVDAEAELRPWIRAGGLGVRIGGAGGDKLFDLSNLGVSVRSIAIHGHYEAIADGGSGGLTIERSAGHLVVNELALPLGRGTGGQNPVASRMLGQSRERGDELAPVLSPELIVRHEPEGVELRLGEGRPPWWVPVQRSFGPVYVEQLGVNPTWTDGADRRLATMTLVMDGGVSISGLRLGFDDLGLSIPASAPFAPSEWGVDLAGLAMGYDSSGVSIAGGLRKLASDGGVEYAGTLEVRFGEFALAAVGSYGEFPVPSAVGDGGSTYSSLFVFAALDYPLGGPPAFFVVGLGAGVGLNRRLVLPTDVAEVPSHTLVRAMDPATGFSNDPMSALTRLSDDFPPQPGTFWLAVGVRFTSFALVESVAVLSAEVSAAGLEIGLLGVSRMEIPTREFVMARLELALRARFSTREAVLGVQGQLTDNSWLLHPSCRLTGGFAFYVWFEQGDFVLTLGGYHPRFDRPTRYPDVPRLGYNWSVSDAITIKGESYFAITASCVMAGGSLEASYDAGIAWAAFRMGWNALIAWDPFFYDFEVYVAVAAGVKIRACVPLLGCATISLSLSIGAAVHVWGPELRGEATLDLDVTSVTVAFGATDNPNSNAPLTWAAFHEKYLVAGDPDHATMTAAISRGFVAVNVESGETSGTGSAADPWRVLPEFGFTTRTRSASNRLEAVGFVEQFDGEAIDLGPMGKADVVSVHRVTLAGASGQVTGLRVLPTTGRVPEGTWAIMEADDEPAARVRPAFVGASVDASATPETAETAEAKLVDVERSETAHPLPFHQEFKWRADFEEHAEAARAYMAKQPTATAEILHKASQVLVALRDPLARVAYAMDVAAPPRVAPLSEGLFPKIAERVATEPVPEPTPPPRHDTRVGMPRVDAVLRLSPSATNGTERTTVSGAADVPRVPPPTLAQLNVGVAPISAHLSTRPRPATRRGETAVSVGAAVATGRAGGIREVRRSLLSDIATAASLRTLDSRLGHGVPLLAGDMLVLSLPNARFDSDAARPTIDVEGDQRVRIVILDRGGDVLVDDSASALSVRVPRGAHRLLIAGLGRSVGGTIGTSGWHTRGEMLQIRSDVFVGTNSVVRSTSPETKRDRRPVSSAVVSGSDVVAHADLVETRLPIDTTTMVVVLENVRDVDETLQDLALVLAGARRVQGEDGSSGPRVVVSGNRAHAVFEIEPEQTATAVSATIASGSSWDVVAVAGSVAPVDEIARVLEERGIDDLIPGLVTNAIGASSVTWRHMEG